MRSLIIMGLVWVLAACSNSVGHNFDTATIQKIKPGQTTRAELIRMFGPPDTESPYPNGQQVMMWKYSQARATWIHRRERRLLCKLKTDEFLTIRLARAEAAGVTRNCFIFNVRVQCRCIKCILTTWSTRECLVIVNLSCIPGQVLQRSCWRCAS